MKGINGMYIERSYVQDMGKYFTEIAKNHCTLASVFKYYLSGYLLNIISLFKKCYEMSSKYLVFVQ